MGTNNWELLRSYRLGDNIAASELGQKLGPTLFRHAKRYLSGDESFATELVQSAFIALFNALEFNPCSDDHLLAWMLLVIQRGAYRELERRKRYSPLAQDIVVVDAPPDLGLLQEELKAAFARYREHLTPVDWEILRLKYCDGVGFPEIANTLNLPATVLPMRASRARAKLRELLIADGWKP